MQLPTPRVTVAEADSYLRLIDARDWFNHPIGNKEQYLMEATLIIDTLAFSDDIGEPDQIKWAVCEQALDFSRGRTTQQEVDDLMVEATTIAGNHTASYRSIDQEHTRNGITSFRAWGLLSPFLRDTDEIVFIRGD